MMGEWQILNGTFKSLNKLLSNVSYLLEIDFGQVVIELIMHRWVHFLVINPNNNTCEAVSVLDWEKLK